MFAGSKKAIMTPPEEKARRSQSSCLKLGATTEKRGSASIKTVRPEIIKQRLNTLPRAFGLIENGKHRRDSYRLFGPRSSFERLFDFGLIKRRCPDLLARLRWHAFNDVF